MAVYCPMYDPSYGWYVLAYGPNGLKKEAIISPLYYYHMMKVTPPIGSKFTTEDYVNLQMDLAIPMLPVSLPDLDPSPTEGISMASPTPSSSQDGFGDLIDLQDQQNVGSTSIYCPLPVSNTPVLNMSDIKDASLYNLAALSKVVSSLPMHQTRSQISSNIPFSQSFSIPDIPQMPISGGTKHKYSSVQTVSSSMSYLPQPSMPDLSQLLTSSKKMKFSNLQYPSTSSNSSYDVLSLPSTSSGIGAKTLSQIATPCLHILPADANSSEENENSPEYEYKHSSGSDEINVDELESSLDEEDHEKNIS